MPNYVPRVQSPREQLLVEDAIRKFNELITYRSNFAGQWEEVAALIEPNYRNTFFPFSYNFPGTKQTDRQIDASGMMALHRFKAICDSLLTPRNTVWHTVQHPDPYVMKDRATKLWYAEATRILFQYRYHPMANFSAQNQNQYGQLGAWGTAPMLVDDFDPALTGQRGIRYKSVPLGQMYLTENHQGLIDGFIRFFRLSARQAYQKWGNKGTFPEALRPALEKGSEAPFDFIQWVCPRTDYDPGYHDFHGMPYASYYISLNAHELVEEGGYRVMPTPTSRYEQAPDETYGRSPAMMILPALKTLNAQKRTFLKAGHRAADPVLLTGDDGMVDFSLRPGALNKGGVNADGRPMVVALEAGQIQISKEMMGEEKSLINDAFLVTLFQILTETPQMSATEVIERTNEKGILLAPTIGRQQSEYLGPMVTRELDVLDSQRLLPPMPPRLVEALKGQSVGHTVLYTSPLARAMHAQDAAGFMRTVEIAKEVMAITQDPSIMDPFEFDVAIPAISEIQGVPPSWMASDESIAGKRKARQAAMQREQQIQAAPAAAAMMKAQAVQAKAGMQPGGQGQAVPAGNVPGQVQG